MIEKMAVGDFVLLTNHKDTSNENFTYSKSKQELQIQITLITNLIM